MSNVNVSLKETRLCGAFVRVKQGRLKKQNNVPKKLICVWGHSHLFRFEDY